MSKAEGWVNKNKKLSPLQKIEKATKEKLLSPSQGEILKKGLKKDDLSLFDYSFIIYMAAKELWDLFQSQNHSGASAVGTFNEFMRLEKNKGQ